MKTALTLAAICLAALLLRVIPPYEQIFRGGRVVFAGNDAWIHMRNADNIAAHWPWPNWFDSYRLAPGGQTVAEAPLMDVLIAGIALVTAIPIDIAGAWFPAVVGALIPIPLFFLTRHLFGEAEAWIASALIAVLPGSLLQRSLLGVTDHHVLEAFFTVCVLLFLARGKPIPAGIFLGLYLLTWSRGAFLLVILIVWSVIARQGRLIAVVFAIALVIAAPVAIHLPSMALTIPTLIGGAAAALVAERLLMWRRLQPAGTHVDSPAGSPAEAGATSRRVLAVLLALAAVAAAVVALPELLTQLRRFIPSGGAATIGEVQPLLMAGGRFSLPPLWFELTTASILMIVGFVTTIRDRTPQRVLLLVFAVVVTAATLAQVRFAYYLALAAAVLAAAAAVRLLWRDVHRLFAVVAIVAIVFYPNVPIALAYARAPEPGPTDGWLLSLDWLRANTPEPFASADEYVARRRSAADAPDARYGVLAMSDYGWWLSRIARRPPVTNPTHVAVEEAARFYTATTEAEAMKILGDLRASYVIADRSMPMTIAGAGNVMSSQLEVLARWAKKDPAHFFEVAFENGRPLFLYYPDYYRTMAVRLFAYSGAAYTPAHTTWAVLVDERNEVRSRRQFASYEEGVRFIEQNGGSWKLVGLHPVASCVPLASLKGLGVAWIAPRHDVKVFEVR